MTPRWDASDWSVLGFWAAVAVLVFVWDVAIPRLTGLPTVSVVMERWCHADWLFRVAVWAAGLILLWHLTLGKWPFGGE